MQPLSDQFSAIFSTARLYAALQDTFRPIDLMEALTEGADLPDPVLMVEVLSLLRPECTIAQSSSGDEWSMRPTVRRKVLAEEHDRTGIKISVDNTPVQMALLGVGDFDTATLAMLIADPDDRLMNVAAALDQAGPGAPAYDQLVAVRAALNTVQRNTRSDRLLSQGFYGRVDELDRLSSWIASPQSIQPLKVLHISGLPGIGKSYLLEKAIQAARLVVRPIMIRLDFDRAALNVLDAHALFEEISRQMGDAVPQSAAKLREMRLQSAGEKSGQKGRKAQFSLPRNLLRELGKTARESGRTVLIVLDTLEVLRSRGETHVMELFEHLDRLTEYKMGNIAVISAGRGDALDPVSERMEQHILLGGLEDWAAQKLLEKRDVPSKLWPKILPIAKGNPLLLALAGRALEGGDFDTDTLPKEANAQTIGGYLYRAILSRVPEHLRLVANQGLILRAINSKILLEVVAPALKLKLDANSADEVLSELSMHHWLVTVDPDGWISHRTDVREAFLPMIYASEPEIAADINRRAAEWFEDRDPAMALYYRLQLVRENAPIPEIDPTLATELAPMLEDFPTRAQDALLQAQGLRSGFGRAGTEPEAPVRKEASGPKTVMALGMAQWDATHRRLDFDPPDGNETVDERALVDLELMLEKGEPREAQYILESGFQVPFAIASDTGVLVMCQLWLSGYWSTVRRMWTMMGTSWLNQAVSKGDTLRSQIMFEVMAEFEFDELVVLLGDKELGDFALQLAAEPVQAALPRSAFEFALITALGAKALPYASEETLGVIAPFMSKRWGEAAAITANSADAVRDRFGLKVPTPDTLWQTAARVMPLNPYVVVLHNYLQIAEPKRLARFLEGIDIEVAAKLFAWDVRGLNELKTRLSSNPGDVVEGLSALGITAQWVEGFTTFFPIAELPTMAAAAEKWRRTINGVWAFGSTPPDEWEISTGPADWGAISLCDYIADPQKAQTALAYWGGSFSQLHRLFSKRYAAACEGLELIAKKDKRQATHKILERLQASGVTMIIAAPLAVLGANGFKFNDILQGDF